MESDNENMLSDEDNNFEGGSESDTGEAAPEYRILQEADIQKCQEDEVEQLSSTLFISKDEARKLLYHYGWNVSSLHDAWFADEERIRAEVGLLSHSQTQTSCTGKLSEKRKKRKLRACGICFESFPLDDHHFYPTVCGHKYCVSCWKDYITISINDGPGCLSLRCPEPKCRAAVVDQDMIDKLVSDEEKNKYARYFVRSYVEQNKKRKWCPAPGCENAVEFEAGVDVYDVTCLCSHTFCWNCAQEVHRPVGCDTVAKWILKNSSDSANTMWILENSKPCPKCKRSIEKNRGCMHMSCSKPCRHQFCWLCLGPWSDHGSKTGGNYN